MPEHLVSQLTGLSCTNENEFGLSNTPIFLASWALELRAAIPHPGTYCEPLMVPRRWGVVYPGRMGTMHQHSGSMILLVSDLVPPAPRQHKNWESGGKAEILPACVPACKRGICTLSKVVLSDNTCGCLVPRAKGNPAPLCGNGCDARRCPAEALCGGLDQGDPCLLSAPPVHFSPSTFPLLPSSSHLLRPLLPHLLSQNPERIAVPPAHAQSVPAGTRVGSSSSEQGIGPKFCSALSPGRTFVPAPAPRPQLSRASSVVWALLPGLRASGCEPQLLLVESGKGSVSAERASVSSLSVSAPGALTSSSIHPDTGTDTGRAQKFLSPEDTTDKQKGATPFYSRCSHFVDPYVTERCQSGLPVLHCVALLRCLLVTCFSRFIHSGVYHGRPPTPDSPGPFR
ncbi:uncharacterized protein LOC141573434 isoform X2 [Camelus bactrianus]|uniref:Uncharacterized protein LOC141573434 isoform X2 n=1 Tax=Camelus bactrianus TaxID=9837 RepID=A0AC58NIR8_CAMBA